jgi:hypothetical protein
VQHPISKTIEKLENPDGADQIKQIWPRRRGAAKGYGQFLPSREEIPGTPRSHSLSSQKIGSATKPLREGPHGIQPADAGLARGRPEVQDEPLIKRGRHRGGHYSTILFDAAAFEVGKYALRNKWAATAIGLDQTAIPANKNSGASSEKPKPHCLYFESHSAAGTLVLITCLN